MRMIAHISDLHFGRIDPPVADGLLADLQRCTPSLLVVSGDFTQRAGHVQYSQAARYLKRLPTPQLVVPGNHDVPAYNIISRMFFPLNRYRQHIAADLDPVYQDDEMLVLGVNTARGFTQKSGWIRQSQMVELRRRLLAAPPGLLKVLVTHHPFIPSPRDLRGDVVRGAPRALAELEQCGLDLLLAGHLHMAYNDDVRSFHKTARRSVLSIQAGTATSTRRRGEANAYNWITLTPGQVTVAVRRWNGQSFEEATVTTYRRVDHAWTRDP